MNQQITINSLKYDGSIGRSWNCEFVEKKDDLLVFVGEFETDVRHPNLGHIKTGAISYEYYWLNRWYNVFRFHEPDGQLRNYYCNVNMPLVFDGRVLEYVDLDIDMLVWKDLSYEVLDREEFEENALKFGYPDEVRAAAYRGLEELKGMIERREFPFDHDETAQFERPRAG